MNKGFTLVEISIVLVVVGLVVSGIVGGQSLISAAKKQKVVQEIEGYKLALNSFKLQFNALPGDMADAYDYWGVNSGPGDCGNGSVWADQDNCNGDNDGRVGGSAALAANSESLRAFQHLYLAEILQQNYVGKFSGMMGTATSTDELSTGLPTSSMGGFYYLGHETLWILGDDLQKNTISLSGAYELMANVFWHTGGVLSPEDAMNIDKKMDDGIAEAGVVRAKGEKSMGGTFAPCLSAGAYNLSNSSEDCVLVFVLE